MCTFCLSVCAIHKAAFRPYRLELIKQQPYFKVHWRKSLNEIRFFFRKVANAGALINLLDSHKKRCIFARSKLIGNGGPFKRGRTNWFIYVFLKLSPFNNRFLDVKKKERKCIKGGK